MDRCNQHAVRRHSWNPPTHMKDHNGIPHHTGTRAYQANRPQQHLPRQSKEMIGRTVLCNYDNQPIDQSRQRNNTNRSYYHRPRTTNHYPTQNEGNMNNDNHSDSESENQQQQETTNEIQQQNQAENRDQKQKETTNSEQQQENVTIRKHKTTSTAQCQINKEPPPKTNDHYPEIQKITAAKENKRSTTPRQQQQPDITTIPETQIAPETQT